MSRWGRGLGGLLKGLWVANRAAEQGSWAGSILASMEIDLIYVLILPAAVFLLIVSAAIAEILKLKGIIVPNTPMWKVYQATRILPGILGFLIMVFVAWYFFG